MGTKKVIAGVALAMAATGAMLSVTALPAAAHLRVSVPGMSKSEFMWQCAESNGDYTDLGSESWCVLPDGKLVVCHVGGNCVIYFIETTPPTPDPRTPPIEQRPIVSWPTAVAAR